MKFSISINSWLQNEAEESELSPSAVPFVPSGEGVLFGAIFNNGVPCMTAATSKDRSAIIRGISDDAIDENFPPDATEAAELEATEAFTTKLAHLSLLEDKEDHHRNHPFAQVGKRWEARRIAGPSPLRSPVRHSNIIPENHIAKTPAHISALLPASSNLYHRNARDFSKTHTKKTGFTKAASTSKPIRYRKPIQQPRKQN